VKRNRPASYTYKKKLAKKSVGRVSKEFEVSSLSAEKTLDPTIRFELGVWGGGEKYTYLNTHLKLTKKRTGRRKNNSEESITHQSTSKQNVRKKSSKKKGKLRLATESWLKQ